MEKLIRIAGEQMRGLLEEACGRSEILELSRVDEADHGRIRTRFLSLLADGSISIEAPMRGGQVLPMRQDEEVFATFNLYEQPYQFSSTVNGRDMMSLSQQMRVPALILSPLSHLERIQRRQSFRIKLSSSRRKQGFLWLLEESGGKLQAVPLGQSEVADLSAGGAGVLLKPDKAEMLKAGDHVILALPLEKPSDFIRLQTEVRSVRKTAEGPMQVGLKFVGLEETPEGRTLGQQIEHHVVALEREKLQQLRQKI